MDAAIASFALANAAMNCGIQKLQNKIEWFFYSSFPQPLCWRLPRHCFVWFCFACGICLPPNQNTNKDNCLPPIPQLAFLPPFAAGAQNAAIAKAFNAWIYTLVWNGAMQAANANSKFKFAICFCLACFGECYQFILQLNNIWWRNSYIHFQLPAFPHCLFLANAICRQTEQLLRQWMNVELNN